jgi:hypothetical protein
MKKILLSVLIMVGTAAVFAQVPSTMSYQGILVQTSGPDAGQPVSDGTHFVRFFFYNVLTGGTALYSSTGTGSGNSVTTYKGMFTFIIGSGSPGNDPIPSNIFSQQLYVEIVADGVTLTPRIPLTTVPYAMVAQGANSMDADNLSGTLNPARIAAGAIDNTKLATGIDASKLTTGTLPAARIGNDAIDNAKMADNAVNTAELTNLAVTTAKLADNSVTSAKIVDGTIATADLADGSVTSAKIADGTVAAVDISSMSATSGQVLKFNGTNWAPAADNAGTGTVTSVATGTGLTGGPITTTGTVSIATGGVTTTLLGDNSVTSAKIVDGTIATADLADGSVTSAKILDATVSTGDLADGSVTLAKHADNSVNSAKLVDGSVATADIADDAVNTAKIGTAGAGDANKVLTTDATGNPQWELKSAVSPLSGSGSNGRVTFWSGTSSLSSSANLFWDNTNNRLGIGTATPGSGLHLAGADWAVNPLLLSANAGSAGATLRFTSPDAGNRTYDIIGSTGTGASMGSGSFGIWDNTSSAYRFVISPSGYIGINSTTPASQLTINSSVPARSLGIDHDYTGTGTQYGITVDMTGGTGTGAKYGIDCNVTGTLSGTVSLYGLETDVNPNGNTGTVYGVNSNITPSGASGNRYGVYSVVGTASGTSSGIGLYGYASGSGTGTHYGVYGFADGAGTNYGVYGFAPSAEAGYAVYASGNMAYTGTLTDVSDQRLKTNIQPMPEVLKKVLSLRPTTFFYKTKEYSFMQLPEEKQLGLIAQEVEEVFPEVVTDNIHPGVTDKDGKAIQFPVEYKGIDYTILVPVLIKAIQEQQALIAAQDSSLADLKAELAELRKLVMAQQKATASTTATIGND